MKISPEISEKYKNKPLPASRKGSKFFP